MVRNMVSPLVSALLFLHFLAFCSLTAVQADQEWHAPNFCSNVSSAQPPICSTDSEIIGTDWSVEMDCSKLGSVIVSYIDPSTDAILDLGWKSQVQILEVSLECYPNGAADGTDGPQDEARTCRSDNWLGQKLGGPYEFSNLSAAGILPGWTCNISACFAEEKVIRRTKLRSCVLPGSITVSASLTTLSVPATSDSIAAIVTEDTTTVNATSDIIISTESDFNMNLKNVNIYLPVMAGLTIITLGVVLLMAVILSSIRIRRHLARKRTLLMYNRHSMVFDPHFYPSVCIDKPAAFTRSPMMSVVSINLLQSLDLTANVYVKEHSDYLPMNDEQSSLNFETDTDDSEAGGIDLSNPTALNIQKSRSNDDISSTHTEIIVESSKFPERACPQSGGTCSEQNRVSSEQGYVQLPHYQQGSVLSPATITRLDRPSDDNDSVLTEVLSIDNNLKKSTAAQRQDARCSTSGYVQASVLHTTCADEQEIHSTSEYVQSSGLSVPVKGVYSGGDCIQSSAVSIPIESKDEPTNLIDLLLNDETYESDDHDSDLHQTLSHATTEGCREASLYFHLANFHSAISDRDSGYLKDTLNHISTTNEADQRVKIVDNSHSESPVAFHPPAMNNETRPDTATTCTSGESLPGKREHLQPTVSSGINTNSSTKSTDTELCDNIDPDLSTYGYIPSELFTRKILVPPSQDSSPAAAGFVVHLDFENRHELLPRTINNLSETHQQVNS